MIIEQLINNSIFCATTRIYAYLTEAIQAEGFAKPSAGLTQNTAAGLDNRTVYITIEEIMSELDLSENTVRNAIRKLINNNLIEVGNKKKHAFRSKE